MEGIHLLRDLLQPHDWLGKIDLKDAYFVVPIWKDHRKYLRFIWKGSLLEFACLPFGLSVAPRLFTKLLKPVVSLLRRTGIRLIIYLDDLLFMNQSKEGLGLDMATAQYLLENLGFVINHEKSCFVPKQKLEFLGFVVDTLCSYDSALARLQSGVNQIPLQRSVGASRGLRPGSLPIDWEVDGVYTSNIPCPFALPLPPASETPGFSPTKELRFERGQGGTTLVAGPPERLERSCASASPSRYSNRNGRIEDGLGGSLPRSTNRGVVVSDGEKASHQLLRAPSRILCCEELHKEPLLCPFEDAHGQHFGRGVCKSSRGDSFPSFVQPGSGSVGTGTQSGFLSQCRALIGASEYSGGLAISALPGHAFPPFCLIMRSLAKLREQGGELVLVTPVWPTQVWYPTLLDLSVSLPVLLPTSQNLLLGPQGQVHPLIANQALFLAAWHVSNNPCNRKAFVQTLPSSSWQLGSLVQTQFITPPGRNGIAGVSNGKVIHFATLWQI